MLVRTELQFLVKKTKWCWMLSKINKKKRDFFFLNDKLIFNFPFSVTSRKKNRVVRIKIRCEIRYSRSNSLISVIRRSVQAPTFTSLSYDKQSFRVQIWVGYYNSMRNEYFCNVFIFLLYSSHIEYAHPTYLFSSSGVLKYQPNSRYFLIDDFAEPLTLRIDQKLFPIWQIN